MVSNSVNMANDAGNVSLKIGLNAYNVLKGHCDRYGYKYGGYAERAILNQIQREIKSLRAKKKKSA